MFHFYCLKACVGCSFNYHCLVWACELVCGKCWSRCLMLCFMWKLILALKKLSALIVGFVWKFPENHLKWIYSISIWSCSAKQDSTLMRPGVSPWDLGMKITRSLVVLASKCTRFGAPPWERLNGPRPGPGRKERQSALQKLLEMQRQDFADAWLENVGNPGWIFMELLSAHQKRVNVFVCSTLFHIKWADVDYVL